MWARKRGFLARFLALWGPGVAWGLLFLVAMRSAPEATSRFSVLLTEDCQRETEHWTRQLPRFLERIGVEAITARSGQEAIQLAESRPIDAAFVDLGTPRSPGQMPSAHEDQPGGLWLLQVLQRQETAPPVVLVNGHAYSPSQAQRFFNDALRLGAFSVINRPVQLEALLLVAQRLIDRMHEGSWPRQADEPPTP